MFALFEMVVGPVFNKAAILLLHIASPQGGPEWGKKKSSVPLQQFSTKTTCVLQYHMCSTVTVMGWRLVVGGGWRLIVGGGWWLGVGGG